MKKTSFVTSFDTPDATRKRKRTTAQELVKVTKRALISNAAQILDCRSEKKNERTQISNCKFDSKSCASLRGVPGPNPTGLAHTNSVLMSVFYAYLSFNNVQEQRWSQQTAINSVLDNHFVVD